MKKKLLAVMLAVFMAATALPETVVMAAVGPGPAEEAVVVSASAENTGADSDGSFAESKMTIHEISDMDYI